MDFFNLIPTFIAIIAGGISLIVNIRYFFKFRSLIEFDLERKQLLLDNKYLKNYVNFIFTIMGLAELTPFEIKDLQIKEYIENQKLKQTMKNALISLPLKFLFPDKKKDEVLREVLKDKRNQFRLLNRQYKELIKLEIDKIQDIDNLTKHEIKKIEKIENTLMRVKLQ